MRSTRNGSWVGRGSAREDEKAAHALRVAMLIQSYHPWVGGAERQVKALSGAFPHYGVDVTVVTRRHAGAGYSAFEVVDGAPVYRVRLVGGYAARSVSYTVGALWRLWRLRRQIDLLHAHDTLSPATTALIAKWLLRKPVVVKLLASGKFGDVAKLRAKRFGRARMALLARGVDRFICISEEIAAELRDAGAPSAKLVSIPNGVDTALYAPATRAERQRARERLGIPQDVTVAIFTGRLIPEKRPRDLVKAWASVVALRPQTRLLVVGTGPEAEALRAMAAPNVDFLGVRDDIAELLRAADIFVLVSSGEGLSNALLEAMASGLACVGSDVGGTRELLAHRGNGMLVPCEEPAMLAQTLGTLIDDVALRGRLGLAARGTVERDFSLESTARRLRDLYAEVLRRG